MFTCGHIHIPPDCAHLGWCSGSKVFPAFVQFLRSSDSEAADKQSALETQLSDLNGHLESNGPFLKGDNISAGDMALAPKLYHLKIALKELKARPWWTILLAGHKRC